MAVQNAWKIAPFVVVYFQLNSPFSRLEEDKIGSNFDSVLGSVDCNNMEFSSG